MKLKWGVIGCGGIAYRRTIPGMVLDNQSELVAVMDTNLALAEQVQKEFHVPHVFDSEDALLALDEIDAVYIATPVFCHKEQVMKAAAAKKHILLEKPMGLTVAESEEIAAFCKAQGVKLGVGLMMRFGTLHEKARTLVAGGELGEIVSMRAQFTCWYPEMPGVWRQNKTQAGGGALMDMGIHCIDLLRYISGMEVTDVAALMGNQIFKYEVEDAASVVMRMENGALAYVDAAFNIPDDAATCKLEIYGTGGSVVLEGSLAQEDVGEGVLVRSDATKGYDAQQHRTKTNREVLQAATKNLYTAEIAAFAQAVLTDTPVPVTAEDAIRAQRIVESAYRAAETRQTVALA
ncbi:MAG: Gfo/Idh/MocA family oxidoreductase [Clostridia bacterium]|nr:Gfo/Idh/MocA family oxidoreductase [Clostridia bacterium]